MKTPSPINWFGGKSRLASKIVQHFPARRTYCEPFGGSAAVLLAKRPSPVEIYNDVHEELVSFFRVLRNPALFASLRGAVENTLYARAEFELAKQRCDDPVEAARRFIVRSRQSFLGKGEQWSYCVEDAHGGMAAGVRRWRWGIEWLPVVHSWWSPQPRPVMGRQHFCPWPSPARPLHGTRIPWFDGLGRDLSLCHREGSQRDAASRKVRVSCSLA
jgi:D12 class N6 adenine-specific DNA methyltransferase